MIETLEFVKTERDTEEELKRKAYNANISENFRKILTMDSSELENGGIELEERKYPSLDAYKSLHPRTEITFENVQIPDSVRQEAQRPMPQMQQQTRVTQAPAFPVNNFQNSIYASSAYREAALVDKRGAAVLPVEDTEALDMPTCTTLQYGSIMGQPAMQTATASAPAVGVGVATAERTVSATSEDSRAYYVAMLKKVAVAFAVAFAVLMTVIIVNTVVLNGMNLQIAELQQTLTALQADVRELQYAIDKEISWESILAFIQESGMIPRA